MYGDKILIQDINGQQEVNTAFEDIYDNRIYCVIDKQALGENIARKLLDADPDLDIEDKDYHLVYEEADSIIINKILEDIFSYAQEYLNNNQ